MRGNGEVLDELAAAEMVFLPLFVLGELHFGFRGGNKLQENLDRLARFLSKPTVHLWLPSSETAEIYGELKDGLKKAGDPIPINDIWIASACVESGSKLVTYDHHFRSVPGLRLWSRI